MRSSSIQRQSSPPARLGSGPRFALAKVLGAVLTLSAAFHPWASARDLLRPGSAGGSPGSPGPSVNGGAAVTNRTSLNGRDQLARTAQAIQAVQAMQTAARNLAARGANNLGADPNHPGRTLPNVPNGLVAGGLQIAPGATAGSALWKGAALPTQTSFQNHTTVTIQQTAPQSVLHWQTFNIGKQTTLAFDQSAGGANASKWVSFNLVQDPSGVPSQILGSITAPGQVYVINRNGIIFGGSSQINLHSFVASSLPINDNLIARGLLNNPDEQFLFSSLAIPALTQNATTPAFTPPPAASTPTGRDGDITVQAGAMITSPSTADHVGGKVALIAPNVRNSGTISTPDGQTILAAGNQVFWQAHPGGDPTLRGLDVLVGAVDAFSGTVTNTGLLAAPRADVTLTGKAVGQLGVIASSTSVALNGRIDLLAGYNAKRTVDPQGSAQVAPTASGALTLGAGSFTEIMPELSSSETVVGAKLALASQVRMQGRTIHLEQGAELLAPSANVQLSAGNWVPTATTSVFAYTGGQVYLDSGASIDVSGSVVAAPMSENIVSVQLLGSELADSPLQRTGPFRGTTIQIDLRQSGIYNGFTWVGTPLADASGYIGLLPHSVGELTTPGGSVTLHAGSSVVMQSGSKIDVSGGWINYEAGMVQTTRVLTGGVLRDISQATPDMVYDGVYTGTHLESDAKWGSTQTFTHPLALTGAHFEQGYVYGADGGALTITAPSVALDGTVTGHTVAGARQREVAPAGSALTLSFQRQSSVGPLYSTLSPTPPKVVFSSDDTAPAADGFTLLASGDPAPLRADRQATVQLSPELLNNDGFSALTISNGDGGIVVPAGVTLAAPPRGSITFESANLRVEGHLSAPSGTISLTVFDYSPLTYATVASSATPPVIAIDPHRGQFVLASGASLSTAGLLVDDRLGAPGTLPLATAGGQITIKSFSADLQAGSVIDVSGGLAISGPGKQKYGNAGGIVIEAGRDANVRSLLGGTLTLDSSLRGFAGQQGGSFGLLAPRVQIGGPTAADGVTLLAPDFFSAGGFASFSIASLTSETVAPGTVLAPVAQNWFAAPAPPGETTLTPTLYPQAERLPVSLSLAAPGVRDRFTSLLVVRGDLILGAGSLIRTEPGGSVSLTGDTVSVLGSVIAPGGSISIAGANAFPLTGTLIATQAAPTVYLSPQTLLSTAGTFVSAPDLTGRGQQEGSVLPGGSITLSGNLAAAEGSRLDVSGASGTLDLRPGYSTLDAAPVGSFHGYNVTPTRVESDAGLITLTGTQELFSDATLIGHAGGPTAQGGTLVISSGRFKREDDSSLDSPLLTQLLVTQNGLTLPSGQGLTGQAIRLASGALAGAYGHLSVSTFAPGGFDSVTLSTPHGAIVFQGPIALAASRSLSVGDGGVISADASVTLQAPHVTLGTVFQAPISLAQQKVAILTPDYPEIAPAPTWGTGSLTVLASLIDIGNLSLQGIGRADLSAPAGDLRGDGTLDIAGRLTLTAGQIYPATETVFTIAASDYTVGGVHHLGSVTIAGGALRQTPLSAGGTLNIYGSIIEQGGTLRAPLGSINLGWDGTGTAPIDAITNLPVAVTQKVALAGGSTTSVSAYDPVSGTSLIIPYGLNLNGTSWIDPAGNDITAAGAPAKTVHIAGLKVADLAGSTIDLRGGGDFYAYRFVPGIGGKNDVLGTSSSFAVIPGYAADYAPYAPFNPQPLVQNFNGDPGYVNTALRVGDQVQIGSGSGLSSGIYTLLPARYALLPGAFLITPRSGVAPLGAMSLPDGSGLVSGYRLHGGTAHGLATRFEVDAQAVVRSRAEYDDAFGTAFLTQGALTNSAVVPRLPVDAGQLVLQAVSALSLRGQVQAQAPGGAGGLVDISSPVDIVIGGPATKATAGQLVLQASELSAFGAESLLIGGVRTFGVNGVSVAVQTKNLTVANAGQPLTAPDISLVASTNLTVAPGAEIESSGPLSGSPETLHLTGDGVILRVTSDASAQVVRTGADSASGPHLSVGAGSLIAGASVLLDSTSATTFDPTASVRGPAITFASGQISLSLNQPGTLGATTGLILTAPTLRTLESGAQSLSLVSYSTLDLYGTGQIGSSNLATLGLHAGQLRGFNTTGGDVLFQAGSIVLDGGPGTGAPLPAGSPDGTISFAAQNIRLGAGKLEVDGYASTALTATGLLTGAGTGGLSAQGDLTITVPEITGGRGSDQTIAADGHLLLQAPAGRAHSVTGGSLGARLELDAGKGLVENTRIVLRSGSVALHATAGDLVVGGLVDVSGTSQPIFDLVRYTDGGTIALTADAGALTVAAGGLLSVDAQPGGGSAGAILLRSPGGVFTLEGAFSGHAAHGTTGSFSIDAAGLPDAKLGALASALLKAGFTQSIAIRDRADALLTVDGTVTAHDFSLSADAGSITVTGTIDASGQTGGAISLTAAQGVTLADHAQLTVRATDFDAAGKGGSVSLAAGALLDLRAGSSIDLAVTSATAESAARGQFGGTLHLRAPQSADGSDLQVSTIGSTVTGASSIVAEGFRVYTPAGGSIDSVEGDVYQDASTFGAHDTAIATRLLGGQAALATALVITPGAEIDNPTGDLTLANDWDLSGYRFGGKSAPGVLTLRAAGNLIFLGALSDGFTSAAYTATLLDQDTALPANVQSWSYHLAAGADFSAADFHQVQSLPSAGSLQLGRDAGLNLSKVFGDNATLASAIAGHFQVIRTGTGDIDIAAAGDVQLLNQFATIYTAGAQVTDPTLGGTFDTPILSLPRVTLYPPQYSLAGGNVTIAAGQDIKHLTRDRQGNLAADSVKELPNNWLYRRGYVDPDTAQFGATANGDIGSTTWWVDFSNFFEGVGTLGGGHVRLTAGRDIANVDAVAATNARMPSGRPSAAALLEFGGGDVTVRAGHDLDAGAYYVERGHGILSAGHSIVTNNTRSPSLTTILLGSSTAYAPEQAWLPTTLFLGQGSFDVSAGRDLLLGPVANPFLLPQGANNTYWDKTYFSTYGAGDAVNVTSLTGSVTLRAGVSLSGNAPVPLLYNWLGAIDFYQSLSSTVSYYQPWLRLTETALTPFQTSISLLPPTLRATAFTGDVNLVGNFTLSPAPLGTVELAAAGSLNALQPNGQHTASSTSPLVTDYGTARVIVSDADPAAIAGVASPYAYQTFAGTTRRKASVTDTTFLLPYDLAFAESGSFTGLYGALQTQQELHDPALLHANDLSPLRLFASSGDISGLLLYSPKAAHIEAGRDVTDVAFYLQNDRAGDLSVVSAGRDLIAYDANSPLRVQAQQPGHALNLNTTGLAGDLQIGGTGTLEVLAGRNLNLGVGPNNPDGTAVGITSIGNARNPALPFDGADLVAAAGLGGPGGLDGSGPDFAAFAQKFIHSSSAAPYLAELPAFTGAGGSFTSGTFDQLPAAQQHLIALDLFFLVLRDTGRDHATTGSYQTGYDAISALFPQKTTGDISLTSREIKTLNGGQISLLAPGGKLTVGFDIAGNQPVDQGILTQDGGNISIFTDGSVIVGTSRIFTLRGGNELIWSSQGDIAAGAASKTVQSAPPTRVLIDPQSGNVETDLAGLATGGGIGVLESVAGVPPGDVALIAPKGTVDAGDAGVRASGNLLVAAAHVANASNFSAGGNSAGVPSAPAVTAPNVSALAAASQASGSATQAGTQMVKATPAPAPVTETPSIITVEVTGYGGSDDDPARDPATN